MKQAVLYVCHGSRVRQGNRQAAHFVTSCVKGLDIAIQETCFLELAYPSVEEGVARCIRRGATHVAVVPVLLLAAGHAKHDIPAKLHSLKQQYPQVMFSYGSPFGVNRRIVDCLVERIREQGEISKQDAVMLVGRGSSDPDIPQALTRIASLLQEKLGVRCVQTAYLAAAAPSFASALTKMEKDAYTRVFVVPYLLFTGVLIHEMQDRIVEMNAGSARFILCDALGYHPYLAEILKQRVNEAIQTVQTSPCADNTVGEEVGS